MSGGLAKGDPVALKAAAMRLLAAREHATAELQRKLRNRFPDSAAVAAVLEDLAREGLLSDDRFAEAYVRERSRKGYGPRRIRAELAERGVASGLRSRCLDDTAIDWHGVLLRTAVRKFGADPAEDRHSLARRARFLEQRGFPPDLINGYLDGARGF